MFGWLSILKIIMNILNKFRLQEYVERVNEIKHLNFKLHKRRLEEKAVKDAKEEIANFRSYLNKS